MCLWVYTTYGKGGEGWCIHRFHRFHPLIIYPLVASIIDSIIDSIQIRTLVTLGREKRREEKPRIEDFSEWKLDKTPGQWKRASIVGSHVFLPRFSWDVLPIVCTMWYDIVLVLTGGERTFAGAAYKLISKKGYLSIYPPMNVKSWTFVHKSNYLGGCGECRGKIYHLPKWSDSYGIRNHGDCIR